MARETMDKAVSYQTELENAKLSGQKQVDVVLLSALMALRDASGIDIRQPYILGTVRTQ